MLHKCTDKYDWNQYDDTNDEDCLKLLSSYEVGAGDIMGHGVKGLVLHIVIEDDKAMAVKILERTHDTFRELYKSCVMDEILAANLDGGHALFSRVYGWIACGSPPSNWMKRIEMYYAKKHTYPPKSLTAYNFYLVSDLGGINLKQYLFGNVDDCKSIIFEVFYALYWIQEKVPGFRHGDVHRGNVLVKINNLQPARRYSIDNVYFSTLSRASPQIIDYEDVSFDNDARDTMFDARAFIRSLCRFDAADQSKEVAEFLMTSIAPLRELEHVKQLLLHPVFNDMRSEDAPVPDAVQCHVCGRVAVKKYEHSPSFAFCKSNCARKMGKLGTII